MKAEGIDLKCGGGSRAAFSDSGRAAGDSAGHGATFGRPVSGAGAIPRLGKSQSPSNSNILALILFCAARIAGPFCKISVAMYF
jgi:hypothetical protein